MKHLSCVLCCSIEVNPLMWYDKGIIRIKYAPARAREKGNKMTTSATTTSESYTPSFVELNSKTTLKKIKILVFKKLGVIINSVMAREIRSAMTIGTAVWQGCYFNAAEDSAIRAIYPELGQVIATGWMFYSIEEWNSMQEAEQPRRQPRQPRSSKKLAAVELGADLFCRRGDRWMMVGKLQDSEEEGYFWQCGFEYYPCDMGDTVATIAELVEEIRDFEPDLRRWRFTTDADY